MLQLFDNRYPYTDLHELNLDWILAKVKRLDIELKNFVALNTIKYADPIAWNITSQYETNTVVIDYNTGTAYLSTQPVPSGVGLNNTDYWTPIFTLDIVSANKNITSRNDGGNPISTFSSIIGDWLLYAGDLYKVIQDIPVHTAYVVGYNIQRYTVEDFIREYVSDINTTIGDLDDLQTTDKDSVVDAINELVSDISDINGDITDINTNIGDLSDLDTTDQTSIVNSINEICEDWTCYRNVKRYGAMGDGVTDDTAAIRLAIADGAGVIYFPPGEYKVTDTISITDRNITLLGSGFTPLDTPDAAFSDSTTIMSYFDGHVFEVARTAYYFKMQGFRIHKPENIADDTQTNSVGVFIKNWVWFYHLEDILITNMYHGIATGGTNFALIKHCIARNNFKHGFYFNNKIEDEFAIDATRAMQVDVIDCLSENNDGSGFYYAHGNADATGSMPIGAFINNKTYANQDYGVMFYGMDSTRGITAVRCDDLFLGNDGRACLYMEYVTFPSTFTNCQIEQAGLSNCGRHDAKPPLNTGAFGASIGSHCFIPTFVDCVFASAQRSGVYLGASSAMFTSCVFYNNNRRGNAGEGAILCASTNNQFVGNRFNETTNGIAFSIDNNSIVTSNNFLNVGGVPLSGHTTYITQDNNIMPTP